MNIIKRNFLRLLRLGAFGENEVIEPMSKFKWEVIFHIANIHNVVGLIFDGIAKNKENEALIPQDIILKYKKILDEEGYGIKAQATGSRPSVQLPDAGLSHMCNGFLNARLKRIRENEPQSADASVETLNTLDIIVQATECTMTYGLSFATILRIGIYLRVDGDKIDFVKLENWLRKLNLTRMAQLEGSILIDIFGFEMDEIPFVNKMEPSAHKIAIEALEKPIRIDIEEWKIRQKSTIFLANNSKAMMKTVKNCMKYFFFAPVEASSNFLHRFASSLSNLEE
ncbi:hypothetical protein [Prevotella sp.]|uniref:hypothetical protein n=1 Tax=Prevotella sp. TaxID=59823 RepID=UPI002E7A3E06|nr:hypothetical protein [Prevotella sp.]MEE0670493.1 hypothetical protein [Prevotella sp.]